MSKYGKLAKEVIHEAMQQGYCTVELVGSLKDHVKAVAAEMNIDTGW